jgi:hypothetical protein
MLIFNAGVAYGLTASTGEFINAVKREKKWTNPAFRIISRHASQQ